MWIWKLTQPLLRARACSDITDEAGRAFLSMLKKETALKRLNLYENRVSEPVLRALRGRLQGV